MGISQSTLAMESGPERDERMEGVPAPEAERNTEEPPTGLVPSAGTLELQPEGETEAPTSTRHTEILELPKVDRRAPATPTVRPGGESATPATGKSRAERKQEAHLGWSEAEPSKFYSLKHVFDMVKNLISQYFVLHVSLFSMLLFMVSICLCEFVEWSLYP